MNSISEKRCNKCGVVKPITEFHRHKKRGRNTICADCHNGYNRNQRRLTYKCIHCKERKPIAEFASKRVCIDCKTHKVCKLCGERLHVDAFDKYHGRVCRSCRQKRDSERYLADRDRVLERNGEWRKKNAQPGSSYRIRQKRLIKERREKRRAAVYEAYGGAICACCGETERMFLTIDHINGGGNQHRRSIKRFDLAEWLFLNNFPEGYQVLCYNCNAGKHRNGGICPHKQTADMAQ